ncbi:MAG TPA: hypothetical protein VGD98_17705 [Ktedonobacteraceae bacterium]
MSLLEIPILPDQVSTTRNPARYLAEIWQAHFADIPRANQVDIAYCQPWKRRLGLIRLSLDSTSSFIGINALLQLSQIPECVLIITIAHELTHYAHGFGSPLPRIYEHPHAHNVVKHEMERRGLSTMLALCDNWIDENWFAFYEQEHQTGWLNLPASSRSARRQHQT